MWPRFGLKMGNSTLCVAHIKSSDTNVDIISNKDGNRTTPACVFWNGGDEIECGLTAQLKMSAKPNQGISNSFELLHNKNEADTGLINPIHRKDQKLMRKAVNYDKGKELFRLQLNRTDDEEPQIKELNLHEIQVKLFETQLELAREFCQSKIQKPMAVLSAPSYFNEETRLSLVDAACEAGFHVCQVIDESVAALLAYEIGEEVTTSNTYVLTIKIGGTYSSFDTYEIRDGLYFRLNSFGPYPIGGQHITESLLLYVCKEFQGKHKVDPFESRRSIVKIRTAVNNSKHILSTLPATNLYVESLIDGIDFNLQMSRARMESLIQPLFTKFLQILDDVVEKSVNNHKALDFFDSIVLFGATSQIPKLQNIIAKRFPNSKLYANISGDEVVAIGCARQCLFLTNSQEQIVENVEFRDVVMEPVVIWHGGDENKIEAKKLLDVGDLLPKLITVNLNCDTSVKGDDFHICSAAQPSHKIHIGSKSEENKDCITTREYVNVQAIMHKSPTDPDYTMISMKSV